eukprot:3491048-Amphidinium_carterae.1
MPPKGSGGRAASKKPSAKARYGLGLNQLVVEHEAVAVSRRQCCWPIGLEKTADGGASLGKEIGRCIFSSSAPTATP